MYNYNDDIQYGEDRLCGSICSVNGHPSIIRSLHIDRVEHMPLPCTYKTKESPLEELDPTPVHIGYCNFEEGVLGYLTRLPERQWKQGLMVERLRFVRPTLGLSNIKILKSKGFIDAFINRYPIAREVEELIGSTESFSKAFHKEYALKHDRGKWTLLYRTLEVGDYNINKILNGQVSLYKEYSYLTEEIEEILHETA